jgi:hypothetical protein
MLSGDEYGPTQYAAREAAVSNLVAAAAEADRVVRAWRAHPDYRVIQPRDLLPWSDVQRWIKYAVKQMTATASDEPQIGYLEYGVPGGNDVRRVPVRARTVLDRLRLASLTLAKHYSWTEPQATLFLLTGITPLIRSVRATILENPAAPALSRITLEIDPSVAPRELAEMYATVRAQFISGRHRDLGEKHTELALQKMSGAAQAGTWASRMAAWNAEHPEWAYTEVANYAHDTLQARRRLLGTDEVAPVGGEPDWEEKLEQAGKQ